MDPKYWSSIGSALGRRRHRVKEGKERHRLFRDQYIGKFKAIDNKRKHPKIDWKRNEQKNKRKSRKHNIDIEDEGEPNHYKVLGVKPWDDDKMIRAAFLKFAKIYHPDKNPGKSEDVKKIFIKIQEAYEVLSDIKRRRAYDERLKE